MIDKYEIKKVNNEEVLYLYLDINYEFSLKKFFKKKDIGNVIKNYLVDNHIVFKGNIISLIVSGVLVGNISLNSLPRNNSGFQDKINYINTNVITKVNNNDLINKIQKEIDNNKKKAIEEEQKKKNNIVIKRNTEKTEKIISNNKATTKSVVTNKNTSINKTKKSTTSKSSASQVDNNIYISLKRANGNIEKIELEEYIIGVVAAEMPASFHSEALKAQAIISRTYALKARSKGKELKDNESNQSYKDKEALKKNWGSNYNTYYNKIKNAVNATKGKYLTYNGNYIEAVFHSTSNGKTEASANVWGNSYSYLISVDSPYDKQNPSYSKTKKISYTELSKLLGIEINNETEFTILDKTSGNRINNLKINDQTFKGVKIRNLLGLRSADFDISKDNDGITFTTRGYGHGVGLSQYGANGYAKNGYSYSKILNHYYPGVSIKKL